MRRIHTARSIGLCLFLALAFGLAPHAAAEDPPSPAASSAETDKYSPEELDEIVAPIALYPDVVLSSMMPASTSPTDVVAAARWIGEQEGEITKPPEDSGWDPAVEAMVQFPDVLVWMSENLDWMEMLGYAVGVQQSEVLDAVQDFRKKTKDAGNLESNEQMEIVQEGDVIQVQPAEPTVVYVPQYEPAAVTSPGYQWNAASFWTGVAVGATGAWAWHHIGWGNGYGHGHGSINISNDRQFNFNNNGNINTGNIGSGNRWNSNNRATQRPSTRPNTRPNQPRNRGGNARPAKGGVQPGTARPNRPSTSPRPGAQPGGARPGGARPGAGTRPTKPPTRPGAGTRPTQPPARPGAGARPTSPPSRPGASAGGRPSTRPSTRPSSGGGSRSSMSGSSTHGRTTQSHSNRGRSSVSRSGSSSGARRGGGGARRGGGRRR